MNDIARAIYERLKNGSVAITIDDRVFNGFAPDGTALPFIVFEVDRTESDADLGGTISWAMADVSVICFAETYDATAQLTYEVRRDLQDWQDDMETPPIHWCRYIETLDGATVDPERSESRRFRKDVNFEIRFQDAVLADL